MATLCVVIYVLYAVCLLATRVQTAVFKNQIDWVSLFTGSARPTQGRTSAIALVSKGFQIFDTVNQLRIRRRWLRIFTISNQSSVPTAYKQFTDAENPEEG